MLRHCLKASACIALSIVATMVVSPACSKTATTGGAGGAGGGSSVGGFGGTGNDCDTKETSCGDQTSGCVACAEAFMCKSQLNQCNMSLQCRQYGQCIAQCAQGDDACVSDCAFQFPDGSSKYDELLTCVICENCPVQCEAASAGCGL
jgi:hypothetical protein